MICSAVVEFACCGLKWAIDFTALADVQGIDLDRPSQSQPVVVLSCRDGRGLPVPPRYFTALLNGQNSRALILDAATRALVHGCRRLIDPPTGEVRAEPELEMDPATAVEKYLRVNQFHALGGEAAPGARAGE